MIGIRSGDELGQEAEHSRFGFDIGDEVTWRKADSRIPTRTVGIVVGFTTDRVCVQFPEGKWKFDPPYGKGGRCDMELTEQELIALMFRAWSNSNAVSFL